MAKRKQLSLPETAPSQTDAGYTVLARRYRPQQFSDLIGQEHVAQALTNALKSGRVAHAYLFTGARGVGKTSTARILAKALNCEKGPTTTPCDQCDICQGIMSGDDVDVVEMDGASNRRIEEIREIRQNVQFRPSRARYKIYIIDEVHMLTREAFNALLKTLEEPPPHVKFIFATTEVQKIPITILSRCQRFDFAGIGVSQILQQLKNIVESENLKADPDALELVARRAGGSMRDAESLLDQLLAFGSEKLTVDQVHALLGTAHDDRVSALASAVLGQNPTLALKLLGEAAEEGLDLGELLNQLIEYWRDLMVVSCAGLEGQTLSVGSSQRETLANQAQTVPVDSILAGLDVLVSAKNKMGRSSQHGRVLVEAALVRLSRLGDLIALSQLAQWLKDPKLVAGTETRGPSGGSASGSAGSIPPPRKLSDTLPQVESKKKSEVTNEVNPKEFNGDNLPQIWAETLAQVSPMFATDLEKKNDIAISGPNTLVIRFSTGYNFIRERCQERAGQLEHALQKVVGQPCNVRIESVETTNEMGATDSSLAMSSVRSPRRAEAMASETPLIKRAMEMLGAKIMGTDPAFAQDSGPVETGPKTGEEE